MIWHYRRKPRLPWCLLRTIHLLGNLHFVVLLAARLVTASPIVQREIRGLLLDTAGNEVEVIYHEEITDAIEETVDLVADSGPCLMVRWVCLAPWHINENPQQHNHCSTQSELLKERFVNSLSIREVARTWWLKT